MFNTTVANPQLYRTTTTTDAFGTVDVLGFHDIYSVLVEDCRGRLLQ